MASPVLGGGWVTQKLNDTLGKKFFKVSISSNSHKNVSFKILIFDQFLPCKFFATEPKMRNSFQFVQFCRPNQEKKFSKVSTSSISGKNCVFWNCLAENGRKPPQIYVGFLRRGLVSNHRLDSSFYWEACKALVIIWNLIMVWDVSRMVRVMSYHHDNESSIPSRGWQLKHYLSIFLGNSL